MFYVRHIEQGHDEVIYEARWVRFTRASGSHEPPAGLHLTTPSEAKVHLGSGMAFVMGESGQTVAKYDIAEMLNCKPPMDERAA